MSETIDTRQLPELITDYLSAHQNRELDRAIAFYTEDAVVTDEGQTFHGKAEIRAWLARSAAEYTYTIELVAAERVDDDHYVALHHLEGNFPGGVADLRFRFTLGDGRIAELVIEP